MRDIFLIKKPWITEKSTALNAAGKYVFMVKPRATKPEIRKAVESLYHVHVRGVNVLNQSGKRKRSRNVRTLRSGYRKAVVTLRSGDTIDLGR